MRTLLLDGTTYKAPADVTVLRGSAHQLEATPTQTLSGVAPLVREVVGRWGAIAHDRRVGRSHLHSDVQRTGCHGAVDLALRATTQVGATAGPSVPGRIRWDASDSGTGISRYDLQRSTDGGAHWTSITLSPVTRKDALVTLSPGTAYRFRLRAHDPSGNVSGWATIAFRPAAVQENASGVTYAGSWTTVSSTNFWGGHLRRSDAFGESVSYTFSGRAVAWVAPVGSARGKVRVYIDGVLKTTIDLGSTPGAVRRVLYATDFSASGRHTIRIANLATSGRPLMDHDAFIVYGS